MTDAPAAPDGTLTGLFVAPAAGAPMHAVASVRAVAGRGLEGDRYFEGAGSFSRWPGPHREVTLIAEEDLAALYRAAGVVLPPEASRRNLLTRGVPLEALVGRTFQVGSVHLEGRQLCQPCRYLVRKTGLSGLLPHLVHRGGLRARIVEGGVLHRGDGIRWSAAETPSRRLP